LSYRSAVESQQLTAEYLKGIFCCNPFMQPYDR